MQSFMDETDMVLGGVKDTVNKFVAATKQHVGEMETSILSIEQKDMDNLFREEVASLMIKNKTLEAQARETEKKIRKQTQIIADLRSKLRIDALDLTLQLQAIIDRFASCRERFHSRCLAVKSFRTIDRCG